jgi:N-acetylmuramoyl-L-alanine amidase
MQYVVVQGDCLSSIAYRFGFKWQQLWDDPQNARLRELRQDPNILYVGDIVYIPEVTPRVETRPTNQTHRFQIMTELAKVRLRLMYASEPRAGEIWEFLVGGRSVHYGTIDDQGFLEFTIPPNAEGGILRVGDAEEAEEYQIQLGHLDPIDTIEGIQERLLNLGFIVGAIDGVIGDVTTAAISLFQWQQKLDVDGIAGPITKARLVKVHGS